jgi:hypothetical protein
MTRNHVTRLGALAIAIAATFAFSIQIAAAKSKAKPQGLWVGGYKYISEFQGKALKKGGTPQANLALVSSAFFNPLSIAFDRNDDLWIAYDGVQANGPTPVLELTRGDLTSLKNGNVVKAKVIIAEKGSTGVPFTIARSLAFDTSGDLWITDGGQREIIELLPKQIKNSGSPTPTISITSPDFVPTVIRFDGSGNLWVAEFPLPPNPSNPMQLWRFTPTDRAASGPANPSLIMNLPDELEPVDLAFDSSGNLWLAGPGSHNDALEMIPASDLGGSGEVSPSASVIVTSSAFGLLDGSGSCLGGIDFDRSGDLWASVGTNNADCDGNTTTQLVAFTPAQLSTGGNLTPSVAIGQNDKKTNLFLPGPLRFGPAVQ